MHLLPCSLFRNTSLLSLGAGAALGVAFLHPYAWWVALAGVCLFFWCVHDVSKWYARFWYGLLAGTTKAALVLSWFWSTYPLDWLGVPAFATSVALIFGYWSTTSLVLGAGYAVAALAVPLFTHSRVVKKILLLPLVLVVAEVAGSFFFSLYTTAPGIPLNVDFSFGYLGYLLAEHGILREAARGGGVYLLSYLYGVLAVALLTLATTRRLKAFAVACALVAVTGMVSFSPPAPAPSGVVGVHTRFSPSLAIEPHEALERFAAHAALIERAVKEGAHTIILPEDSRFRSHFPSDTHVLRYLSTLQSNDTVLVDTMRTTDERGLNVLRAFLFDTATWQVYTFDKRLLVPQGEYLPSVHHFILSLVQPPEQLEVLRAAINYRPGVRNDTTDIPPHLPGVLFCSESISPWGARTSARPRGTRVLAHPVSHAWFQEPALLHHQLGQMLAVNSRFAGVAVVPAVNLRP